MSELLVTLGSFTGCMIMIIKDLRVFIPGLKSTYINVTKLLMYSHISNILAMLRRCDNKGEVVLNKNRTSKIIKIES